MKIISKKCTKCDEVKIVSEFGLDKHRKDGFKCSCKECIKEVRKVYLKKNKEKIAEKKKIYDQENRCRFAERVKKYLQENRERIAIREKKYRQDNKNRIASRDKISYVKNKEKRKKYLQENRERIAIREKKYRQDNKEKIILYFKEYRKTDQCKITKTNSAHKIRYQKISSSNNTIPVDRIYPLTKELSQLLIRQNHKCNICYTLISREKKNIHLDHYVPLSKGGSHSIDNVQWLCAKCNFEKGSSMPKELLLI